MNLISCVVAVTLSANSVPPPNDLQVRNREVETVIETNQAKAEYFQNAVLLGGIGGALLGLGVLLPWIRRTDRNPNTVGDAALVSLLLGMVAGGAAGYTTRQIFFVPDSLPAVQQVDAATAEMADSAFQQLLKLRDRDGQRWADERLTRFIYSLEHEPDLTKEERTQQLYDFVYVFNSRIAENNILYMQASRRLNFYLPLSGLMSLGLGMAALRFSHRGRRETNPHPAGCVSGIFLVGVGSSVMFILGLAPPIADAIFLSSEAVESARMSLD